MAERAMLQHTRREASPAAAIGLGAIILAAVVVAVGVAWAAAVPDNSLFGPLAPRPVFAKLLALWGEPAFWTATSSTVGFGCLGFAAALIVGVVGALVYRLGPQQGRALAPLMVLLQAFPTAAMLPIIVLFFGVGAPLGAVFAFGLAVCPAVQVLRLSAYAPGRGATACAGLFGLAMSGAVAGEYVAGQDGLGARLLKDSAAFEMASVGAVFVHLWLIALIGCVVVAGIAALLLRAVRRA